MPSKIKKIQLVYFIYWVLLAYIIAALVFWFISLSKQNVQMAVFREEKLNIGSSNYQKDLNTIKEDKKLKTAQYIGEGFTFLILILAGAVFVFRSVRRQIRQSVEQQNFLIAITHELKTPIAVTKLNLETLQKRKLDESQQKKLLHNSIDETNRLNALCNNLLLSSQLQSNVYKIILEPVNWSAQLQQNIREFAERYPDRPLQIEVEEDCIVHADPLLLGMVANNLLDNALKYSPKGKTISITLKKDTPKIEFCVCDEGQSIAEDERKKIFDKFYRAGNEATRKAKGTGLGLYLCQKIIKSHGGTIFADVHVGGGNCFKATIPAISAT